MTDISTVTERPNEWVGGQGLAVFKGAKTIDL